MIRQRSRLPQIMDTRVINKGTEFMAQPHLYLASFISLPFFYFDNVHRI